MQFCDVLGVPVSQVLDGIATARQPKADPLQALRSGYGVRLAKAWERLNPKTQGAMLKRNEESAGDVLGTSVSLGWALAGLVFGGNVASAVLMLLGQG
jgi:hypothetical protein